MEEEEEEEERIVCEHCGQVWPDESEINDIGCSQCTSYCDDCDALFHSTDLVDGICDECYQRRGGEQSDLYSHSYRPYWKRYIVPNTLPYWYMGFELEIEGRYDSDHNWPSWTIAKEDASLKDGYEIVTHPFTLSWWRVVGVSQIREPLEQAGKSGHKSHETTTCGLHIHVSRSAFSRTHLRRFLHFWYGDSTPQIYSFARREPNTFCGAYENGEPKAKLVRKAYEYSGTRYAVCNTTNRSTIEVRIFRGTMRLPTLTASLELIHATVEWTRSQPSNACGEWASLTTWVRQPLRMNRYRALCSYLERRNLCA